MVTLAGKSFVVAGGAGGVGEGIVRALLRAGARVTVPSRERPRLDALRALLGSDAAALDTREADVGDPASCARMRDDLLHAHGAISGVVSAIGGWWQGARLTRVSPEDWARVFHNNVHAPWVFARTFLETLQATQGATYTLLSGSAALEPVIEAGPSSIAGAATLMMARALAAEAKGTHVRVNTLVLGPVRTRNTRGPGMPEWLTADEVGAYVTHLVSDEGRMISGAVVNLFDRPAPVRG